MPSKSVRFGFGGGADLFRSPGPVAAPQPPPFYQDALDEASGWDTFANDFVGTSAVISDGTLGGLSAVVFSTDGSTPTYHSSSAIFYAFDSFTESANYNYSFDFYIPGPSPYAEITFTGAYVTTTFGSQVYGRSRTIYYPGGTQGDTPGGTALQTDTWHSFSMDANVDSGDLLFELSYKDYRLGNNLIPTGDIFGFRNFTITKNGPQVPPP